MKVCKGYCGGLTLPDTFDKCPRCGSPLEPVKSRTFNKAKKLEKKVSKTPKRAVRRFR